jgi:nucleotide-binding universal stress UspA family protein
MTTKDDPVRIRRILVAVDASAASVAALEAAAALAARLRAEIEGLFVEDINLLRLARLPFAREQSYAAGLARQMGAEDMERALRAQARLAQQAFERAAGRLSVRHRFRVVRGQVVAELVSAAAAVDLVALGQWGQAPVPRRPPGAIAHAVAVGAGRTILLLPPGGEVRPPTVVIYDGSAAAAHALTLAADIARNGAAPITVLVTESGDADGQRLQQQAVSMLEKAGAKARLRALVSLEPADVAEAVRRERPGTLVLPADVPLARREDLAALLETVRGAVLLVR